MCRSTEDPRWRRRGRDRLTIRAFYLRFSIISSSTNKAQKENSLPRSLTLHYLPRISGSPLDINDAPIPSGSSAFLTLHRVTSLSPSKEAVFASRERVRASEGARFEVYWREEKVLKGVFRRKDYDEDDDDIEEWKLDCRCAFESHVVGLDLGLFEVSNADVCIEIEDNGHRVLSDKIEMSVGRRMRKKKNRGFVGLEEIPEEREVNEDNDSVTNGDSSSSSCCDCCCSGGELDLELRSEGGGDGEVSGNEENEGLEVEIEGVRRAVDVGIWVMCLGVGYLVSVASLDSLRRRRRSPRRSLFF
ncbi:hypothetical protein NE237_015214 [Protea cynaroides]|uniref:Uncharacterized protein n=1 Tax=Protea cynaroides TaxID=273540 RepID=A0A9Q0KDF9_9MAGN|nr:hypothetical protein NE237_015214 [Protea cynaroides]